MAETDFVCMCTVHQAPVKAHGTWGLESEHLKVGTNRPPFQGQNRTGERWSPSFCWNIPERWQICPILYSSLCPHSLSCDLWLFPDPGLQAWPPDDFWPMRCWQSNKAGAGICAWGSILPGSPLSPEQEATPLSPPPQPGAKQPHK